MTNEFGHGDRAQAQKNHHVASAAVDGGVVRDTATRVKGTGGALRVEKSYLFIDKKPVIDELRTLVEGSGYTYRKIADDSDVSIGTLRNWFGGKTIGPKTTTVNKVARLFGKRVGLIDI